MNDKTTAPLGPDATPFLVDLFKPAIDAARPALTVPLHLPPPPKGRTIVIGAGTAAASMAAALEARWPGPIEGLVVTRYGHGGPPLEQRPLERTLL